MVRDILVGVDLGTTNLKTAAFEAGTGLTVAHASQRLSVRAEADGTREQSPLAIRRALRKLFRDMREQAGSAWDGVAGIGLGAQGGSAAIVHRQTGEPYGPMMLWNDGRGLKYLPDVVAQRPADYWQKLTLRSGPGAGLGRMLWLKRTRPELFGDDRIYAGAGEYAYFLMTGVWRQDACNALQIGCYHVPEDRLDADPLSLVDVPLSFVAPLRSGHETHPLGKEGAALLGVRPGVPVAGPYIDHEAGYQSAWGIAGRPLQCSLGTAWVGNFVVPSESAGGSPIQFLLPSPVGGGRLVILPLLTGNVAWDWGLKSFVAKQHARALAGLEPIFAEALVPPDGLVAVPWVTQPNSLFDGTLGAGTFYGLNAHTGPAQMIRALACGLSYELARVFGELAHSGLVDSVVLGGGASKGSFFRKILSVLLAPLPVYSLADEDLAGARGAVFAFSRETARSEPVAVDPPDPSSAQDVLRGFGRYETLFDKLYGDLPGAGTYRLECDRDASMPAGTV